MRGVPSNTALKERMLEIWFDLASITEVQRKQSETITIVQTDRRELGYKPEKNPLNEVHNKDGYL